MSHEALARLNLLPAPEAMATLLMCCGSAEWARKMTDRRPFAGEDDLLANADRIWAALDVAAWIEAFANHPRIGAREAGGPPDGPARWSAEEQAATSTAPEATLQQLREANERYEAKFGRTFIVCATGRTVGEMLESLTERLDNDPDAELRVAAEEQRKIMHLRLQRVLNG